MENNVPLWHLQIDRQLIAYKTDSYCEYIMLKKVSE